MFLDGFRLGRGRWFKDFELRKRDKILYIERVNFPHPVAQHCTDELSIKEIVSSDWTLLEQGTPAVNDIQRNR